jgi:DNA-binding transcriptional LysR family regulator
MYELIRDAVLRGDGWAILPTTLLQSHLKQQQLVSLATETALAATYFQCLSRQANRKVATWLKNRVSHALTHEFKGW